MAEKRIGRRVKKTTCKCSVVEADNSISKVEVELYGNLTLDRAQNAVRKKLKNTRVLVESVSYSDFYCSMSVEDFIKYGTISD